MKTITGLDSPLRGLDGEVALDGDRNTPPEQRRPVLTGHIIANVLAGSQSTEPARAVSLAIKLFACPKDLEMEDADYALVLKTIQDAPLANISKAAALAVLNGTEPE